MQAAKRRSDGTWTDSSDVPMHCPWSVVTCKPECCDRSVSCVTKGKEYVIFLDYEGDPSRMDDEDDSSYGQSHEHWDFVRWATAAEMREVRARYKAALLRNDEDDEGASEHISFEDATRGCSWAAIEAVTMTNGGDPISTEVASFGVDPTGFVPPEFAVTAKTPRHLNAIITPNLEWCIYTTDRVTPGDEYEVGETGIFRNDDGQQTWAFTNRFDLVRSTTEEE